MHDRLSPYLITLRQVFRRPAVAYAFAKAALAHRRVEHDFRRRLLAAAPGDGGLRFPHMELPPTTYWQRNFFSILFLSIFDAIGVARQRRHQYGLILHAVRGIVTATDNILDGENKGAVALDTSRGGAVLPNVLLILLQDSLVHQVIAEAAPDASACEQAQAALAAALFAIGQEETGEEQDVETVLEPEDLIASVHRFRGGKLLELAFVVPEVLETGLGERLARAKSGVYHIGLALQLLDDLTDFAEDVRRRNHNILRSWAVHHGPDGPMTDAALAAMNGAALAAPEVLLPRATTEVLTLALDYALAGFDQLHAAGHPLGRRAALALIESLFRLRGVGRLWELYVRTHRTRKQAKRPVAAAV
jgi:hypothetical protein